MQDTQGEDFFNQEYLDLYKPILTEARTQMEVKFLEEFAFDQGTKSILDIPCGYGRHALLLGQKGFRVHGIDSSEAMLEEANRQKMNLPPKMQSQITFESFDMRFYQAKEKFDAAINLFTSFGYFEDSESNEIVLKNICNSVRSGGLVILDIRNSLYDIIKLSLTDWKEEEHADDVHIIHTLNPLQMRHSLIYHYPSGNSRKEKIGSFRGYFLPELADLFSHSDYKIEKTFGNFRGDPYSPATSRLIIVARRN